jgi:hypothetical protein
MIGLASSSLVLGDGLQIESHLKVKKRKIKLKIVGMENKQNNGG